MNIYVGFPLTSEQKSEIEGALLQGDRVFWDQDLPKNEKFDAFHKAEVVFGNIPLDWIEKSENLKWLQLYSTGLDPYQKIKWEGNLSHIKVTNLKGFYGIPVAETAVGGILALYRKLDELAKLQKDKKWLGGKILRPQMHLLQEKKVLILGAGAIGLHCQKLLKAFSCNITMLSRSSSPNLNDLDNLLPEAEIIINCLPETPETLNVLDKRRIQMMNKNALFINVGRGSVVDEPALVEALKNASIKGAVLDVSIEEPLPEDHPLWDCSNVLITQHTGGGYAEENLNKSRVFIENLHRYRRGEELSNLVNFNRGY